MRWCFEESSRMKNLVTLHTIGIWNTHNLTIHKSWHTAQFHIFKISVNGWKFRVGYNNAALWFFFNHHYLCCLTCNIWKPQQFFENELSLLRRHAGFSFFGYFLYLNHSFSNDPWPTYNWGRNYQVFVNVNSVKSVHKIMPITTSTNHNASDILMILIIFVDLDYPTKFCFRLVCWLVTENARLCHRTAMLSCLHLCYYCERLVQIDIN